jgi:hypothetical protein
MRRISVGVRVIGERGNMRILPLVPLVTLVLSCMTGTMRQSARATEPEVKITERVYDYASEQAWMRSGYWRITDTPGRWPWFAVVSGNTACPAWAHELIVPTRGEYYQCKSGWRIYRQP